MMMHDIDMKLSRVEQRQPLRSIYFCWHVFSFSLVPSWFLFVFRQTVAFIEICSHHGSFISLPTVTMMCFSFSFDFLSVFTLSQSLLRNSCLLWLWVWDFNRDFYILAFSLDRIFTFTMFDSDIIKNTLFFSTTPLLLFCRLFSFFLNLCECIVQRQRFETLMA